MSSTGPTPQLTTPRPSRRRPSGREWWIIAAAIAVVVAIAAVGVFFAVRGGANGPGDPLGNMVDRVASAGDPEASIIAVDVAAAREALDLPADANPVDGPAETEEERVIQAQFSSAFSGLAHLRSLDEVASEAIDLSAITTIVGTTGRLERSLTLVETSQDFEALASVFESSGYERTDNVLSHTGGEGSAPSATYTHVAWSDGVLALTSDPEADASFVADALTMDPSGDERSAVVNAHLGQAPAVWIQPLPDGAGECVAYTAVRESFTGTSTIVLGARDDVESIEPTLDEALRENFSVGEPQPEGAELMVEVEASHPQANLLMYFPELYALWTCR